MRLCVSLRSVTFRLLVSFIALCGLAACDGNDGAPGSPGPPAGVDIGAAGEINAVINSVRIASPPVVNFSLTDAAGNPLRNLPASALNLQIAKLIPGTDGNASAWQSYVNSIEMPGVGPGTEPKAQADSERAGTGTLVENTDGTYTYTFSFDIANVTAPVPVAYEPALTHRLTFEIRGFAPVRNPIYDFRPSDGATTGLFTREIANISLCNDCHEDLAFHGDARFGLQDCVVCHNPGSADANSGNTVDMTVMTHKIHYGEDLPSVIGGTDYCIYGRDDEATCYGDVVYPQDIRNCRGCHDENDAQTPDAHNWYMVPTDAACGSCHDDVNFETGENHGNPPPIAANNFECASCHSDPNRPGWETRNVHRIPVVEAAKNYRFKIETIDFLGPGTAPDVTFSVTNPMNNDMPYNLADNQLEIFGSPIRFNVGWDTIDYSNADNGVNNAQPSATNIYTGGMLNPSISMNGDGTYTIPLSPVVATATGTGIVTFEGSVTTSDGSAPVMSTFDYFGITDDPMSPVSRRTSVDIERCNDCHALTSFHDARNNDSIESCQVCHVADAARGGNPSRGPMDMKHFMHRKHAVDPIRYPQRTTNCLACHTDDGFYPVAADSGVLATSVNGGVNGLDPTDNNRISPNTATCGVCHSSADATVHMAQNGGSVDACQESDGTTRARVDFCGAGGNKTGALVVESCGVCHGPGRSADTAREHDLDF